MLAVHGRPQLFLGASSQGCPHVLTVSLLRPQQTVLFSAASLTRHTLPSATLLGHTGLIYLSVGGHSMSLTQVAALEADSHTATS